jgi:hypothetical protein
MIKGEDNEQGAKLVRESPEDIVKLVRENPWGMNLVVNNYMIRLLMSSKNEEQIKYNEVLALINELQAEKSNISNTDKIRLNNANNIIYEVSSNISRLDTRIQLYNKQFALLEELVKEHLQLIKPKYNLIFKKK